MRDILATPFQISFKSCLGGGEGEISISRMGTSRSDSDSENCVVEGLAEISNHVPCDLRELGGKWSSQANLVDDALRNLRVWLGKGFVGWLYQEGLEFPFKFGRMFPSPCDLPVCALEGVRHG